MSVNEKLITVDHLKHIRGYVNCATKHAIENLDEDLHGYIDRQIKKVEENISTDFDGDYSELENRLAELEKHFGNDDDSEEIAEVKSQINDLSEEVSNKLAVLNSLRTQLAALQSSHDDLSDKVESGSVFNEDELKEIIDTALIEKTTITDDMVETPNVYTSNLVALIAKFGQIKADSILGNEITGKTLRSLNNKWELNNDGSGKLANGKIKWTADGNVQMSGVKISWSDINDAPSFDDVTGGITAAPSKFKSIVFKRGDDLSGASLTGGSWSNPRPTDSSWSDGIPTGTGKIWMSWKLFLSDDSTTADWSVPALMVDTESFEVAYATIDAELENSISAGLPKDNKGNANPNGTFTGGWTDEPVEGANVDTYIYMATASCDNGVWGPWTVSKIKGEDGKDGTSIRVSGYYATEDAFFAGPGKSAPADPSECYVVAGNLWVWDPTGNQWRNVGQFKGDAGADGKPGDTYYLHIKYAKDIVDVDDTGTVTNPANITLTADDGESTVGAKWIGVGHSKNSVDPSPIENENLEIYKWTKFVTDAEPVSYKSVVFTRATADKDLSNLVPTGGSYLKPIPVTADGVEWEDGIPSGEGIIWSTYYTFVSNVDYTVTTAKWAKPTKMVDEADKFETAYGTADVLNDDGSINESGLPVLNGVANPNGVFTGGWNDEPIKGGDYHYMATASYSNGTWSPWRILKIKGEKGDKGGSVKLSVAFNNVDELIAYYSTGQYGNEGEPHDIYKDNAHIIKNGPNWENHLFVWVGTETGDESLEDGDYFYKGWYDSGQFNGKDGKDGVSSFVSTVFIRSSVQPTEAPTGGNYTRPIPTSTHDGKSWEDGIPAGSEILWASNRTFSTDGSKDTNWSIPAQMTDTASFDVEYSSVVENPGTPATDALNWENTATEDTIWMATRSASNGVWGPWTVTKIKGEDGKSAYIHIKYAESLTYDSDGKTVIGGKATANGGEDVTTAKYMGVCNNDIETDPALDTINGWKAYKWSKISVDDIDVDIEKPVETAIAKYNITTNHIAAKTFDSAIDQDGKLNYVDLPSGLPVELFETEYNDADGRYYDTGKSVTVEVGDSADKNGIIDDSAIDDSGNIAKGPAWQIRKDGTGHLAAGNVHWNNDGDLTVRGKILGSLGDSTEDMIINGDLKIKDDNTTVLTLLHNYDYTNSYDVKYDDNGNVLDPDTVKITLASGMTNKLYKWTISDTDVTAILNDNTTSENIIPGDIYTKESFVNSATQTYVSEIYYANDNDGYEKYFVLSNYQSAQFNQSSNEFVTHPSVTKKAWIHSPFVDVEDTAGDNYGSLYELMDYNSNGTIWYSVGSVHGTTGSITWGTPAKALSKKLGVYYNKRVPSFNTGNIVKPISDGLDGGHTTLFPPIVSPVSPLIYYISIIGTSAASTDNMPSVIDIYNKKTDVGFDVPYAQNGWYNYFDESITKEDIKYIATCEYNPLLSLADKNGNNGEPQWTIIPVGTPTKNAFGKINGVTAFTYIEDMSETPATPTGGKTSTEVYDSTTAIPNETIKIKDEWVEYSDLKNVIKLTKDGKTHTYFSSGEIIVDEKRVSDLANTAIYSDGTIVTNELIAKSGQFDGVINSYGNFRGKLVNATGSIKNATLDTVTLTDSVITNSSINLSTDNSITCGDVLNISPGTLLDGTPKTTHIAEIWAGGKEKTKSEYIKTTTSVLGYVPVSKGDSISIKPFYVAVVGYQPRKKDGKRTKPTATLYWKYAYDPSTSPKELASFSEANGFERGAEKFNGRQYTWIGEYKGTGSTDIEMPKNGTIVIYVVWDALYTKHQTADWPSCHLQTTDTSVTVTPNGQVPENSMFISKNGIVIKALDGSSISTVDGKVMMMSPSGSYGLQITDDGILVKRNGGDWTSL